MVQNEPAYEIVSSFVFPEMEARKGMNSGIGSVKYIPAVRTEPRISIYGMPHTLKEAQELRDSIGLAIQEAKRDK